MIICILHECYDTITNIWAYYDEHEHIEWRLCEALSSCWCWLHILESEHTRMTGVF